MKKPPCGCDYLISVNKNAEKILDMIKNAKNTKLWLKNSLAWVPYETLDKYEIF